MRSFCKKLCGFFAVFFLFSGVVYAENFLALSDIHFDPLSIALHKKEGLGSFNCDKENKIIQQLIKEPVSKWKKILVSEKKQWPTYTQETNFTLLQSMLDELKVLVRQSAPFFVLYTGDTVAHNIRARYDACFPHQGKGFLSFITKLHDFVARSIRAAVPTNVPVYFALGNNDAFKTNYNPGPGQETYGPLRRIWKMPETFSKGGYYQQDLPHGAGKLLVLNTVVLSRMVKPAWHLDPTAKSQYLWLSKQLKALERRGQRAIIALHIPFGIDTYASIQLGVPMLFLQHDHNASYVALLQRYHKQITAVLAGHTHADEIRRFKKIPFLLMPAVSPVYGNNPALRVYHFEGQKRLFLRDATTYFLPLIENAPQWSVEYHFSELGCTEDRRCLRHLFSTLIKNKNKTYKVYEKYFSVSSNATSAIQRYPGWYRCSMRYFLRKPFATCVRQIGY